MKAIELMNELFSMAKPGEYLNTCDTCKAGNPEREVKKAAEEKREPVVIPAITQHYFRHTFCTRLFENEVPYETLKVLMGHSSIKTSIDIYTSISNNNFKRVKKDIEGVVKIF